MCGMKRKCLNSDALRVSFAFITITILSLLVPLSFVLLASLSSESYLSSFESSDDQISQKRLTMNRFDANSTILRFFCYTNPFLVQALVSVITLAALFHGLTRKNIFIRDDSNGQQFSHRLYAVWIFLCTFQVSVGLGIEAIIKSGISSYKISLGNEIGLLSRVIFFLGLHETTSYWSKSIIKPVVDDTVFGVSMQESAMHKVCLAIACGWLWWWRVRCDVETLVVVPEIKLKLGVEIGSGDFVSWWLFYVVVVIGLVRIVRSFIWGVMGLCCRSSLRTNPARFGRIEGDEKV